jgi:hypothetical protein
MGKFRKKPIVVEAIQLTALTFGDCCALIGDDNLGEGTSVAWDSNGCIVIKTLEGNMFAYENDWIIKGIAGELYPCKPDIFEQTYEEAT